MDDNFIIQKLIDILNSNNRNLVLGNISNPRPNSICPVNTSFGIVQAYNINCTYPGEAVVVWDKDENKYYCFTTKPSEIVESKKLVYRKNRPLNNNTIKGKYIFVMDTNLYKSSSTDVFNIPAQNINTNIFFEKILKILRSDYTKIYIGVEDTQHKFFNYYTNYYPSYVDYNPFLILWNYLRSTNKQVIFVKDTELDIVDDIFWLPLLSANVSTITFSQSQIKQIEKIASKYGVILQGEWKNVINNNYLLNIFYNKYHTKKLATDYFVYNLMYSNLPDFKDAQINSAATGYIVGQDLKDKNILAYTYPTSGIFSQEPITTTKYPSIIYWDNSKK